MGIQSNLIDAKEAAEIIGVTRGRVIQLVTDEQIKPIGKIGNAFVFDRAAIKEYAGQERPIGRPKKSA